jgi:hypothetical protein
MLFILSGQAGRCSMNWHEWNWDELGPHVDPFRILQARAVNQMRAVDIARHPPGPEAVRLLPAETASRHNAIPLRKVRYNGREVLAVAFADPPTAQAVAEWGWVARSPCWPCSRRPSRCERRSRSIIRT